MQSSLVPVFQNLYATGQILLTNDNERKGRATHCHRQNQPCVPIFHLKSNMFPSSIFQEITGLGFLLKKCICNAKE